MSEGAYCYYTVRHVGKFFDIPLRLAPLIIERAFLVILSTLECRQLYLALRLRAGLYMPDIDDNISPPIA